MAVWSDRTSTVREMGDTITTASSWAKFCKHAAVPVLDSVHQLHAHVFLAHAEEGLQPPYL